MSKTAVRADAAVESDPVSPYLEMLALIERLHRLLLDVVKDEFERLQIVEVNPVQGLLLFNIGDRVLTAGELKTRGYYQGSNVSYNLKKLVTGGFVHHQRSKVDRRSVRVQLTAKGQGICTIVKALVDKHASELTGRLSPEELERVNGNLKRIERFWADSIRYTY
ncbi:MAG TPA: MarR family winged helix-turn-helix transcriptional regulator [Thermohalobaculum sp.]|nr:MarR family winged helix-turn-helix transcriptional regulator [Thermohalobaculum sp.]